jgi:hypothetical protein
MGPTEVIRGSHLGLQQWTNEQADAAPKLLRSPALDGYYRAGSTIPAGSLLIFNTRCFHRTALRGNRCDVPRDIVTNTYVRLQLSNCKPIGPCRTAERVRSAQALPCIQKVQLVHPVAQQADGDTLVTDGKEVQGVYKHPHALLQDGMALSTGERLEGGRGSLLWQLLGPR